jgi:hypothetical protein
VHRAFWTACGTGGVEPECDLVPVGVCCDLDRDGGAQAELINNSATILAEEGKAV